MDSSEDAGLHAPCPHLERWRSLDTGALEVVYATGDVYSFGGLGFDFTFQTDHSSLWLWSEDQRTHLQFSLPEDALGPRISSDHDRIVFRRDISDQQSELWVVDADGEGQVRLATIRLEDFNFQDPEFYRAAFHFDWVPSTHFIYYSIRPNYLLGGPMAYDVFVLLDASSGRVVPLAQQGEALEIAFSSDGRQAAVMTADRLRLVNTRDGSTKYTIPISLRSFGPEGSTSPAYSPDGKYIVGFTESGILRVNASDGRWQVIPVRYVAILSPGDSFYARSPKISWIGSSTILMPTANLPEGVSAIDDFELLEQTEATFTVWQIELEGGSARPVGVFTGFPPSATFSPAGDRIAFAKPEKGSAAGELPQRTWFLADLRTGDLLGSLPSGAEEFVAWSPDSSRFVYYGGNGEEGLEAYLGQMDKTPTLLGTVRFPGDLPRWVDATRFLMRFGCDLKLVSVDEGIQALPIP